MLPSVPAAVLSDPGRGGSLSAWMNRDTRNNTARFTLSYSEGDQMRIGEIAGSLVLGQPNYVVIIPSVSSAPSLVRQLAMLPFVAGDAMRTTQVLLTDTGRSLALRALVQEPSLVSHMSRVSGVGPLSISPSVEGTEFKTAYNNGAGSISLQDDVFAAYAYDSVFLAALAITSVRGEVSGAQVSEFLRRVNNSKNSIQLSRVTFADAVQKVGMTDSFTIEGATGSIRFTPEGSRETVLFERWTVDATNPAMPLFTSTPLM